MRATRQRFKIRPFTNPRTGSVSWRVTGTKRDGSRVRENFTREHDAKCKHIELEAEFLTRQTETSLRATNLTDTQLKLAEMSFKRLSDDADLPRAVDSWLKQGRHSAGPTESPRLDDAIKQFNRWLDGAADSTGNGICTLREISRKELRIRVTVFGNGIGNLTVDAITTETIEEFLGKLKVSAVTRDNYKRAISRFFSWCIERPRRWTLNNPCREIRIDKGEKAAPVILTIKQCSDLLRAAEREGIAPYVAVCLFGGLRPFEAARLDWQAVNLQDKEIRLEGNQTKTGRARVVTIGPTLLKWLKRYKGTPLFPPNWRKAFDAVKEAAGFGTSTDETKRTPWTPDAMRHTAISYFFRDCGSYGRTAEQFGNSEPIIKAHYQGRVSTADAKKFFALKPSK
ncbi:MAG: tyrosine-type recombinase/integrase [Verrucomicrobiia bacterium]